MSNQENNRSTPKKRSRRPNRNYPLEPYRDALNLAQKIKEIGVNNRIRRQTLMDKLEMSASGKASRDLITATYKYGLIKGSYKSEHLSLTDTAIGIGSLEHEAGLFSRKHFELAIHRIGSFQSFYETVKESRLPDLKVIADELINEEVDTKDSDLAAKVFRDNVQYLGLVEEKEGHEHLIDADKMESRPDVNVQTTEVSHESASSASEAKSIPQASEVNTPNKLNTPVGDDSWLPSLHIDVNIHIDESASLDQIEAVFSSMSKHFRREAGNTES